MTEHAEPLPETNTANSSGELQRTAQRVWRVIRAELVLEAGRASLIARIVLACTTVMLIVMIFRIPGAALGAYYPVLLSRDSPRSTARSALRTSIACILGTIEFIFGAMMFAGSPFLHLFWVIGNLFAVFYLISCFTIYDAALALGLIVTNAITTWDMPVSSGIRVRQTLLTLLTFLVACAVSVIIEYLFAETHPADAVLSGIRDRLSLTGKLLQAYAEDEDAVPLITTTLSRLVLKGTGALRERLTHSSYDIAHKERLSAALALSGRLVELALSLAESAPRLSYEDRSRFAANAARIAAIESRLVEEEAPDWLDLPDTLEATLPLLDEMGRTIRLIAQAFTDEQLSPHHHLPEPGETPGQSSFASDAFTDPKHMRFAIRGTLSALACYLFYMSVGWTGLSASIATCILTAMTHTGATRHKQLLRFAGVILGACVLGFATQTLILPQVDSLFSFALIFSFVIAIGAWVGTSGPRIAYAGTQIVLAYDLVSVNVFTIDTSLIPARDAVLGILMGIGAMWLIFDHLWATSTNELKRDTFISVLRDIASLDGSATSQDGIVDGLRLMERVDQINRKCDKLRSLVDLAVFEPNSQTAEEVSLTRSIKALQPELRALLVIKASLLQHQLTASTSEESAVVSQVQHYASQVLLEAARMMEGDSSPLLQSAPKEAAALAYSATMNMSLVLSEGSPEAIRQMRLGVSLLDLARSCRYQASKSP